MLPFLECATRYGNPIAVLMADVSDVGPSPLSGAGPTLIRGENRSGLQTEAYTAASPADVAARLADADIPMAQIGETWVNVARVMTVSGHGQGRSYIRFSRGGDELARYIEVPAGPAEVVKLITAVRTRAGIDEGFVDGGKGTSADTFYTARTIFAVTDGDRPYAYYSSAGGASAFPLTGGHEATLAMLAASDIPVVALTLDPRASGYGSTTVYLSAARVLAAETAGGYTTVYLEGAGGRLSNFRVTEAPAEIAARVERALAGAPVVLPDRPDYTGLC